jgi:hypothetical protein
MLTDAVAMLIMVSLDAVFLCFTADSLIWKDREGTTHRYAILRWLISQIAVLVTS